MLVTIESTRSQHPFTDFEDSLADSLLTHYATELLEQQGCDNLIELRQAVKRATEVCNCMHLPLRENFKVVYRSRNGEVVQDWRLSPMAYMLMVLNANSSNSFVARTQVEIVQRALNRL